MLIIHNIWSIACGYHATVVSVSYMLCFLAIINLNIVLIISIYRFIRWNTDCVLKFYIYKFAMHFIVSHFSTTQGQQEGGGGKKSNNKCTLKISFGSMITRFRSNEIVITGGTRFYSTRLLRYQIPAYWKKKILFRY